MKQIAFIIMSITLACSGSTSQEAPITTSDAGTSVCILPGTGGMGSVCNAYTPELAAWTWLEPSQSGEVEHRCNEVTCPSGATCVVQRDVSGLDDGGDLLIGTCQ